MSSSASDLFTPTGFGGAYRRATHILFARKLIVATVIAVLFPFVLIFEWTAGLMRYNKQHIDSEHYHDQQTALYKETVAFLIELLLLTLLDILAKSIVTVAALRSYDTQKRDTNARDCTRTAVRNFCRLFCTGLLVQALILLVALLVTAVTLPMIGYPGTPLVVKWVGAFLLLAFVVALVFAIVPLLLIYPVILQEDVGYGTALRRCWALAAGSRCYLGCTVFVLVLVVLVYETFIKWVPLPIIVRALLLTLPFLCVLPFESMLTTVVYMDLRVKKEDLTAASLTGQGAAQETEIGPVSSGESSEDDKEVV